MPLSAGGAHPSPDARRPELLVEAIRDYAIYMLDQAGFVVTWNSGAGQVKGYTADEIIGQHFSRFFTAEDQARQVPDMLLATARRDGRCEAEGWRMRKDGSLFWADVIIDAIRDPNGDLVGFAKITRDITERREAQIALHEAQQQAAHAQKMEALGQLTGGVAHDFNNLLMVVSGHSEMLKRWAGEDPRLARSVAAIQQAAARGATLTRQLLTFSRRHLVRPSVFHIGDRIAAFNAMLASSIGAAVRLAATIEPDTWPIRVDGNEFELALVNLVLNARDAMASGGVVTLTTANVVLSGHETMAKIEGEFVVLKIADTGTGIAPDVLPKVFDPFFTTKPSGKGSGLGLSQVYGFAHQSGGTVTIDSELGRGTTVTLYLPRGDESLLADEEAPAAEGATGGIVLVVEDNPDVGEVTASMLEELGYQVQLAGDADTALAAIGKTAFDLVVSDIIMAGPMDGLALARAIRERKPGLPVLLVTGYSQMVDMANAEFIVMRKPFGLAELSWRAARMIAGSKQPAGANVVRLREARLNRP